MVVYAQYSDYIGQTGICCWGNCNNYYSDADGDAKAWFAIYPQGEEPYQSYPGTESMAYANSNSEQAGSEPLQKEL